MAAFRTCDDCGYKMSFGRRRNKVDGKLLCDGCTEGKPGAPGRPVQSSKEDDMDKCGACSEPIGDAGLVRQGSILVCGDGCPTQRTAADEPTAKQRAELVPGAEVMVYGHELRVIKLGPKGLYKGPWGNWVVDLGGFDGSRDGVSTVSDARQSWHLVKDGDIIAGGGIDFPKEKLERIQADEGGEIMQGIPSFVKGASHKTAHDSGDGETIFHCPFCGAGQVIARSDGTVHCGFCKTSFTVQVQPEFPSMPQTMDGKPVNDPSMPGDGTFPELDADDGFAEDEDFLPAEDDEDDEDDEGGAKNPIPPQFQKKKSSYRTATGATLGREAYIRHVALEVTDDRETVLAQIRAENGMGR